MKKQNLFNFIATLFTGLVLLIICVQQLKNIKPFEVQKLLPEDHPIRLQYESYNQKYDDENKVFALIQSYQPFTPKKLTDVYEQIHPFIKFEPKVIGEVFITKAKYFKYLDESFQLHKFINNNQWTTYAEHKLNTPLWENTLLSADKKSTLLSFTLSQTLSEKEKVPLVKKVIEKFNQWSKENPQYVVHFLGTEVANYYFTLEMLKNQTIITPLIFLSIGLFIFFLFKSFKAVFWSFFIMIISYASMIIIITLVEDGIGPYSSFALFFVLIVATSDLVHFFTKYGQMDHSIQKTIQAIQKPCFLTSLTTSIGFLSLIFNENVPVRYFGIYCALGTFICFAFTFYLLPFGLAFFNPRIQKSQFLNFKGNFIWNIISRFGNKLNIFFILLTLILAYFSTRLEIDDNLYKKFIDSHPLSQSVEVFSSTMNFVGSIDITIKANQGAVIKQYQQAFEFEKEIQKLPTVAHIKTINYLINEVKNEITGDIKKQEHQNIIFSFINLMLDYGGLSSFYQEEANEIRTIVFLNTLNSKKLEDTINQVQTIAQKFPQFDIKVDGFAAIRNYINQNVIRSFVQSFGASFIFIFIVFLIIFRSIKWSLLAMLPNILPLITISGMMGLLGITMESNLVILVCITIGIAVDDTIHFVMQFRKALENNPFEKALEISILKTFKALVSTTSIFIFCLPIFFIADLKLFVQIGLFILISLVMALISDFLLLPSLLNAFRKKS